MAAVFFRYSFRIGTRNWINRWIIQNQVFIINIFSHIKLIIGRLYFLEIVTVFLPNRRKLFGRTLISFCKKRLQFAYTAVLYCKHKITSIKDSLIVIISHKNYSYCAVFLFLQAFQSFLNKVKLSYEWLVNG